MSDNKRFIRALGISLRRRQMALGSLLREMAVVQEEVRLCEGALQLRSAQLWSGGWSKGAPLIPGMGRYQIFAAEQSVSSILRLGKDLERQHQRLQGVASNAERVYRLCQELSGRMSMALAESRLERLG